MPRNVVRMSFRIELFVAELDASIRFYEDVLGFQLERRETDYASLRHGDAVLGLGSIAKLPTAAAGPGFSQERLALDRGAGVEIVLEVDDLDDAFARVRAAGQPIPTRRSSSPGACATAASPTQTATTSASPTAPDEGAAQASIRHAAEAEMTTASTVRRCSRRARRALNHGWMPRPDGTTTMSARDC
jgi:catechol 2,3-dioxygenase-like lactoylglutathione lyase family enzyme